jgi:hypothetical protein
MSGRRASRWAVSAGQIAVVLGLAEGDACAGLVQRGGEQLDPGADGGQRRLLGLGAFQAGKLLILQAFGLGLGKADLMLHGGGLGRSGDRVLLGAITGGFLAVGADLAIKAGTERVLAAESVGNFGGLALGLGQRRRGLGDFRRQGAHSLRKPSSFQLHRLQLYEVFNLRLHLCIEVYGIHLPLRKWGDAIPRRGEPIGRRV